MATEFFQTAARIEAAVIKDGPVSLRDISGFNDGLSTLYLQLFDLAVLPTTGVSVPKQQARVPPGATFNGDFSKMLRAFHTNGLAFAFSQTPDVYTTGAGAVGWLEAVFEGED